MDHLDEKVLRVFGDVVVDKRLARVEAVRRLPRFIAEYLISKYSSRYPENWVEVLTKVVEDHYPEPKDKDRVLDKAMRAGEVRLIDEFKVEVDLKTNMYYLHIPCLQVYDALVTRDVVSKYERIFSGLWGIGVLEYVPELLARHGRGHDRPPFTPLMMVDFEPFQIYNIDVRTFIDGRRAFTFDEWVDLLVRSVGLNPSVYSLRQKLLFLIRLVPLVEGNVNLAELGPRATGKTYLYRNISHYARIYSGGTISAARLFYDARLKIVGDIGTKDVVVFDEISKVKFVNADEVIAKLKDYMVDGFFERGLLKRGHSDCSLVFMGNVELDGEKISRRVLSYLPSFMRDPAFLDRVHGLLPGWELPKIQHSDIHLAKGYGLAVDYLSEVLHEMRKNSFESLVEQHVELVGDYTIRDERALKRMLSGLLKLLFPHKEFTGREVECVVKIAVELRQNVVDILSDLAPREFPAKRLSFKVRG